MNEVTPAKLHEEEQNSPNTTITNTSCMEYSYPTQPDEIDIWLQENFGIVAGACSSIENLRYNTAKMIAKALWPNKVSQTNP